MPDLSGLIAHWGYFAIFLFVVLGNMGLPVPEESILILSGSPVWQQDLRLPIVLVAAVLSTLVLLGWRALQASRVKKQP